MFLDITLKKNPRLIELAFELHKCGKIMPDTFLLDLDALLYNAEYMKKEADRRGVKLYYMLKQLGRNPLVAKELEGIGYAGAVAVDYNEAGVIMKNNCKLGHVGHLVQIPKALVYPIVKAKPEYITVYSVEKAGEINEAAKDLNVRQKVLLRAIERRDTLYPGQYGGFYLKDIMDACNEIKKMDGLEISGLCSFPCFLYDEKENSIAVQPNAATLLKAKEIIQANTDIKIDVMNMPSLTCYDTIELICKCGGNQGEPGHGLTGTTPYHAHNADAGEIPAVVYVSEISHNFDNKSYCYGGGNYKRSRLKDALTGTSLDKSKKMDVEQLASDSIDYHITLKGRASVSDAVVMAFRFQLFVTRSSIAVVKGLQTGKVEIMGTFNPQGEKIQGWSGCL